MVEGEFALTKDHLETMGKKPVSGRGILCNETELNFMLADLAVMARDEAALRQYASLAEETAVRDGHLLYQAAAHRAKGVMHRLEGEYTDAEARLNQALELFQKLETRWQIARTLYELAELAVVRTDPAEARDYFSRALSVFEEMEANPYVARTREALRSLD